MIVSLNTTLGTIADAVGAVISDEDRSRVINSISSDSREIGKKCLFVPLSGPTFDGHDYIAKLAESNSIEGFLCSKKISGIAKAVPLRVDDTLLALGKIGRAWRSRFSIPVIGITGTNGKTTTKELIACALSTLGKVHKSQKNYNNEIGVPFTLMEMSDEHDFSVVEMGMNHTGEISRLSAMSLPTAAVITNAGEGHLEFLESVENVAKAKSEIMEPMEEGSFIVLNEESECFDVMMEAAEKKNLRVVTVGIDKGKVRPEAYKLERSSSTVRYKGIPFSVPLYGVHNIYNILCAIVVAEEYDADLAAVSRAFLRFENVGKRSDVVERSYVLVNDTYNSNPLSVRFALRSLSEVYPAHRRIAVLSDMKELGERSNEFHYRSGEEVAHYGFALLFTWGDFSAETARGALENGIDSTRVRHFESKDDLINALRSEVRSGDAVLVKGSRSMKMEEVAESLV